MALSKSKAIHKLMLVVGLLFFLLVTIQVPAQSTSVEPATLATVFESSEVHFFADPRQLGAIKFVKAWRKILKGTVSSNTTEDTADIPQTGALVFLGDDQLFADFMKSELDQQNFDLTESTMKINDEEFPLSNSSTVLVTRLKDRPQQTLTWIRWSSDKSPEQFANELTAYGKFGVLVFQGSSVVLKTTWPVTGSALQKSF